MDLSLRPSFAILVISFPTGVAQMRYGLVIYQRFYFRNFVRQIVVSLIYFITYKLLKSISARYMISVDHLDVRIRV